MKINKGSFVKTWKILVASFNGFSNDKALKLSASLAYYTVFSLAPLLILVISLVSIFMEGAEFRREFFSQINGMVGPSASKQIQEMVTNVQLSGKTGIALVTGIITLVIGATSVFLEIQDSINMIWRVKAKPKKGWLQMLKNRFLSFSLIVSLGFLLLVSLVINGLILALQAQLVKILPNMTIWVINGINLAITFFVISFLFGIIFKFLPDVKIKWRDVRAGAFFTALLFMLGKYLIGLYIEMTATESAYGAAGSIIVLLVWIYYTSAILYFGAEFTQVYAEQYGGHIEPADYAVHVQRIEKERDVAVLPPQNPQLKNEGNQP